MRALCLLFALVALAVPPSSHADAASEALLGIPDAAAVVPGSCTSENAPDTPKGAECRCSAAGRGATCIRSSVHVECFTKSGEIEICLWLPSGCYCHSWVARQRPS